MIMLFCLISFGAGYLVSSIHTYLARKDEPLTLCPECKQMKYDSYFLFKPKIETADVCHNANSTLCKTCFEPECELAGRVK